VPHLSASIVLGAGAVLLTAPDAACSGHGRNCGQAVPAHSRSGLVTCWLDARDMCDLMSCLGATANW
jgi:hypothetical protein